MANAQLFTQGGPGSQFVQMNNHAGNTHDWTRTVGVGYFNTGAGGPTTPMSFLHVYNVHVPLPHNGSITDHSETFGTTVGSGQHQQWRMERGELEIGRLFHGKTDMSFHIRAVQAASSRLPAAHLFLENSAGDGLQISANAVAGAPPSVNGFPLDRRGYVALGSERGWSSLENAGPWSRLHLTHQTQGAKPPHFGYRPQMRNGITLTGNSDLAYVGQWFDQGSDGMGPEVDDGSGLVIAISEEELPFGSGHGWDNISFRFFGDMARDQGASGTVLGLELMRIRPYRATANSAVEGFVGIGNFLSEPDGPVERLDIKDGRVRIRQLPKEDGSHHDKVLVVDDDGVIHWRPYTAFSGRAEVDSLNTLVEELTIRLERLEAELATRKHSE